MDEKIFQEWYCGECKTYIRFRLNINYNRAVVVVCPSCAHRHQRYVENGVIVERGRVENAPEEICPPKSATSKKPATEEMRKNYSKRDAVVIKSDAQIQRDNYFAERWIEIAGREEL